MSTAHSQTAYPWTEIPERRGSPRVPLVVAVKKRAGPKLCLCQSLDISPTGMSLRRAKDTVLPVAAEVSLEFSLPGGRAVYKVRGRIVRDSSSGRYTSTAVVFQGLPARLKSRLQRFLSQS